MKIKKKTKKINQEIERIKQPKRDYTNIIIILMTVFMLWWTYEMKEIAQQSLKISSESLSIVKNIDSKFRPIILEKVQIDSYSLLLGTDINKTTFTTNPIKLPIPVKKENSGDIKKLMLGYFIEEDIIIRDITKEKFLTIDLTGNIQEEFLEFNFPENPNAVSEKSVGLFLHDIENVKTNLLHVRYIGYANDTVNVTGLLFFDDKKLKIHLLYGEEISNNSELNFLYKKIKFDSDPFWKKRNINDLTEFKKYIINQRKLFIKELQEIGE